MHTTPDEPWVLADGEELSHEDWVDARRSFKQSLYLTAKVLCGYDQVDDRVHSDFCAFLENEKILNKCALMPRDHRKTTVGTKAGSIFEIIKNPNIRILLANEKAENAEGMLREIKWHFESNAFFRFMFPELIPKNFKRTLWSTQNILIPREAGWSEPTIDTTGVGGTKVSMHYDVLLFDDLVGLAALESPTVMKKTIRWLNYSRSLKVSAHTTRTHLIGTRWDLNDVYSHAVQNMGFAEFRRGALVLGDNGPEPFYPLVVTMEELEHIITSDPFQWATNYANDPFDASTSDFKPEWLKGQDYRIAPDGDIRYTDENGQLCIQRFDELTFYLHVDPSMGETDESNETAFVLVGLSKSRLIFIIDAWKKRIDPVVTLDNIFDYQDSYAPRKTTVEGVAYQKSLIYFANDRAKREHRYLNIESFLPGTRRDKLTRIRFTLQPYYRDHRIYHQARFFQYIHEYNSFGRSHPDILDALSQGPSVWKYPLDERSTQRRQGRLAKIRRTGATGYGA